MEEDYSEGIGTEEEKEQWKQSIDIMVYLSSIYSSQVDFQE